jgi:hypothetical protein
MSGNEQRSRSFPRKLALTAPSSILTITVAETGRTGPHRRQALHLRKIWQRRVTPKKATSPSHRIDNQQVFYI